MLSLLFFILNFSSRHAQAIAVVQAYLHWLVKCQGTVQNDENGLQKFQAIIVSILDIVYTLFSKEVMICFFLFLLFFADFLFFSLMSVFVKNVRMFKSVKNFFI